MKHFFAGLFLLIAVFFLVGCGRPIVPAPPQDVNNNSMTTDIAVYYAKNYGNEVYLVREIHEIAKPSQPTLLYKAALEELIQGKPETKEAYTILPPETHIRGIRVDKGVATIDFSREVLNANVGASGESLGIQSIVNTLTEFSEIDQVAFEVEGTLDEQSRDWWGHVGLEEQPFARDLSSVHEPAIWVDEPTPNQKVSSPLTIKGSARVFEATVNIRLLAATGETLEETFVTASAGAPERGEFTATLISTPAPGTKALLEVFWNSPKDGSEMDKVEIALEFD